MYNKKGILSGIIKEPSKTISELPLTNQEYAKLLFPGKLNGNKYYYDKDAHCLLVNKLASRFHQKGADFIHKAGIAFALIIATKNELFTVPEQHYDAIEYSLNCICSLPLEFVTKSLGAGFTGVVFDYDEQNVVKIAYNRLKNKDIELWNYQIKYPQSCFPKITYIDKDFVIMEKLITKSPKLDLYKTYIDKFVKLNFLEEISFRTLNATVEELPADFAKFVTAIRQSMSDVFDISCIGDLKIENLGQRASTGEIVMFDPIGGYLENHLRITNYYQSNEKDILFF